MVDDEKPSPKDGDCVLHCGHPEARNHHFFKFDGGSSGFTRPDGTIGFADWIVACDACMKIAGGNPMYVAIRGDAIWKGDEPVNYKKD